MIWSALLRREFVIPAAILAAALAWGEYRAHQARDALLAQQAAHRLQAIEGRKNDEGKAGGMTDEELVDHMSR